MNVNIENKQSWNDDLKRNLLHYLFVYFVLLSLPFTLIALYFSLQSTRSLQVTDVLITISFIIMWLLLSVWFGYKLRKHFILFMCIYFVLELLSVFILNNFEYPNLLLLSASLFLPLYGFGYFEIGETAIFIQIVLLFILTLTGYSLAKAIKLRK